MASDDQSAKKRSKKAQKQPSVSKKVKVTEEEKAKQEAKKAKEADKLNAEKREMEKLQPNLHKQLRVFLLKSSSQVAIQYISLQRFT